MGYKGADLNSNSASFTFVHGLCTKKKKSVFYLTIKKVLKARATMRLLAESTAFRRGCGGWGGEEAGEGAGAQEKEGRAFRGFPR